MSKSKILVPFAFGVATGVYAAKNWSTIKHVAKNWAVIQERTAPAAQQALKDLSGLIERGRKAWMEAIAEPVSDGQERASRPVGEAKGG